MAELSLIEILDDLPKVRNTLLDCKNRDEVVTAALNIIRKRLHPQITSIFLFSKDGRLERVGTQGIDVDGNPIDNSWFPEESYEIGESFTGKVALPKQGSKYGEALWSENLNEEQLEGVSKNEYLKKLGGIECAIGVPLNGQHRTYGVLEIINKLDSNDKGIISCSNFCREEMYWLDAIGANVATSLSNLRRNNQIKMLTELGSLLVKSTAHDGFAFQSIGDQIVKKLLNPDTSFKVCILRIGGHLDQQICLRNEAR
jgi:hypothetical protein